MQAWLRLAGHEPVPAIYGPSGDVKWDEADPTGPAGGGEKGRVILLPTLNESFDGLANCQTIDSSRYVHTPTSAWCAEVLGTIMDKLVSSNIHTISKMRRHRPVPLSNRVVTNFYDDALCPLGLKVSQFNILIVTKLASAARPAQGLVTSA